MAVVQITAQDFEAEVLRSQVPVVVDIFTPNCGPCRVLAPVFERVAEANADIKFVKVNAEDALDLCGTYGVRGVPTVIAFKGGEETARFVGFKGENDLTVLLESFLEGGRDEG